MQQIIEEKLDKTLKERYFQWNFKIQKAGIYGIEITASAKSWQQNLFKSFFKDDNLTVKIDNLDLLTSATHFHGIGTPREWFKENMVPNGKFLKQIGDTYFYWSPN